MSGSMNCNRPSPELLLILDPTPLTRTQAAKSDSVPDHFRQNACLEGYGDMEASDCRAALELVRMAIEETCPAGVLPSEQAVLGLYGPEPIHEAEALAKAIIATVERLNLGRVLINSVRVRFTPKATHLLHSSGRSRSAGTDPTPRPPL
ncbi:MAG: hypothetical protein EOR36_28050 [Mesorhizobium sp.]|nr:MAG: hypothetical protein EOQ36_14465 [Mesorhizobium sp.]RWI32083.1 MAG: hypothetical protein EOR14_35220 [Mesorhizobium sp.]RWI53986.1 MAG: hypothetical protein EOR15_04740 [Mesorhizobium sp.]RWJ80481.1 MAG: hypothetical protein EOR36_28050 [Mesorhizobium sp.]TIQ75666.1 MAG: hypothetical protein E5X39_33100 [Mesorhizobium sp.]